MPDRGDCLTRVYIPLTARDLADAKTAGSLPAGSAHAVTAAIREWYTEGDTEEYEYVALTQAAEHCLHLLRGDPASLPRRIVVAADVPAVSVTADAAGGWRSAVQLSQPVPLSAVASIHVDEEQAQPLVAQAVAVILPGYADTASVTVAALGEVASDQPVTDAASDVAASDEAAQLVLEDVAAIELLWYDISELDALLAMLG